jgi:hypothetical protein
MITKEVLAARLSEYLKRQISLEDLVDWAETAMMDEDFEGRDLETVRDITSRLGLADVREFGLTWEDCDQYLTRLGYRASIDVVQAQ